MTMITMTNARIIERAGQVGIKVHLASKPPKMSPFDLGQHLHPHPLIRTVILIIELVITMLPATPTTSN